MSWKLPMAGVVVLVVIATAQEPLSSNVSLEQVQAAARIYFRDIDELPMRVIFTRVVLDASGKQKKQSRNSTDFLFHGYNPRLQRGTFTVRYGIFKGRAMKESLAGDAAVLFTGIFLKMFERKDVIDKLVPQVEQAGEGDHSVRVKVSSSECSEFKFKDDMLFPEEFCGRVEYQLAPSERSDLRFQSFSFDAAKLPIEANIRYLGPVQILSFHVDEDFQQAFLPNDPKPFLMPRQVVTTISTSKGKIVMTNQYEPKKQAAGH